MAEDQLFRVTFSGVVNEEYDRVTTLKRFADLFRLKPKRVVRLFSGKTFVLRDNVSEDKALEFAMRIADVGCECYIEPVPAKGERGKPDRRNQERRTVVLPRKPERRVVSDRRDCEAA